MRCPHSGLRRAPSRRSSLACVLVAMIVGVAPLGADARDWIVAADGSGDRSTIQAAINAAAPGDQILLQDGTYIGVGNRDLDTQGKAVRIRPLVPGSAQCIIDCRGATDKPRRAFFFHTGETPATIVEGLRIRRGLTWDEGGAIRCEGASPTLRNLIIETSQSGFGGGLACLAGSAPIVEGCRFTGNRSDFGSAAACRSSSPQFTDCVFENNERAEIGGGLLCEQGSHPTITGCRFSGNHAEIGGALACRDDANPRVTNCEFRSNHADGGGGEGGAAWCANSSPVFTQCVFVANEAVGHGGAVTCVFANPTFLQCTLYGNRAPVGGGIYSWLESRPTLVRTVIAFSPEGEAVTCEYDGSATLACSNLYGNVGGDWTGAITPQAGASGNRSLDPLFCAAPSDLHLRSDSPCLPPSGPGAADGCGTLGAFGAGCDAPQGADLAITKVCDRPSVHLDGEARFTITLVNRGPRIATGILFGDPLPDALNLVSFACSRGTIVNQSYCALDSLVPGDSVVATLVAKPIANPAANERWCENTAYIEAVAMFDPNLTNNQASALVYIDDSVTDSGEIGRGIEAIELGPIVSVAREGTRFEFAFRDAEPAVDLSIYDVRGRRLARLAHGAFARGMHRAEWRGQSDAERASGIYFVRLRAGTQGVTRKFAVAH